MLGVEILWIFSLHHLFSLCLIHTVDVTKLYSDVTWIFDSSRLLSIEDLESNTFQIYCPIHTTDGDVMQLDCLMIIGGCK